MEVWTALNTVAIEPKFNHVAIQSKSNKVDIEVIRIHTDYYYEFPTQTIPENKEV